MLTVGLVVAYMILSLDKKKLGLIIGMIAGAVYILNFSIVSIIVGALFIIYCVLMIKELNKDSEIKETKTKSKSKKQSK